MMKSHESKMLSRVRQWRKDVHQADKTKPASKRTREDEEFARKFGLPLVQTDRVNSKSKQ